VGRAPPGLDGDEVQARIEPRQIICIRREDKAGVLAGSQNNGGVNHIRRLASSAELASRSGAMLIERVYRDSRVSHERGEARLVRSMSPDLANNPRGHDDWGVQLPSALDVTGDTAISPVEGDEGAHVED
jgi:hypothetical protein